jgi:hypothetical protein
MRETARNYGQSDGQLAALPEGQAPAVVVSSPPYADAVNAHGEGPGMAGNEKRRKAIESGSLSEHAAQAIKVGYGDSLGNIGNDSGDTFWSAALTILRECHALLRDGGHAVFVCKNYVRGGAIVEFSQQWVNACESVGFRLVHWHKAMLTTDHGTQLAHDGNHKRKFKASKSFFRRLHEHHASAKLYWQERITDRAERAGYLRQAHREEWTYYRKRLTEPEGRGLEPPTPPTRSRIWLSAALSAYADGGEPWMPITTRIDHEDVLCFVKGKANGYD